MSEFVEIVQNDDRMEPPSPPRALNNRPGSDAYRDDVSISDAHNFIGFHNAEPELERRSSRKRPGFNVHEPMYEDDSSSSRSFDMIDNSLLVYIPMQLKSGVTVQCRPDVLARCPSVLRDLNNDVQGCLDVLPPSVHAFIRRTQIWVNTTYYYGHRDKPRNVNHSTAHHCTSWLFWARDKPEKVKGIEIYNCFEYQAMRLHWNGCGLLLHEFCHLIHQFTLVDSLENATVIKAFESATNSGLYDSVLRRDWAALDCEEDMAYCMVNHKEFFSEMSVTFLADAYHELDHGEKTKLEACSPPLMAPTVVERVRSKGYTVIHLEEVSVRSDISLTPLLESKQSLDKVARRVQWPIMNSMRGVWQLLLSRRDSDVMQTKVSHCNKFYPFTKGQFKNHDPDLFAVYNDLWAQVATWNDEEKEKPCMRLCSCWQK